VGLLDGKKVVVTGAGRGIGAAIARLAAQEGSSVVVNDLSLAAMRAYGASKGAVLSLTVGWALDRVARAQARRPFRFFQILVVSSADAECDRALPSSRLCTLLLCGSGKAEKISEARRHASHE
jgi:NAD(P)-dependent dehydrogenase (short-subunit alcohol dehydrogenase family)